MRSRIASVCLNNPVMRKNAVKFSNWEIWKNIDF